MAKATDVNPQPTLVLPAAGGWQIKSRERTGHGHREAVTVHSRGGLARRGINTLHCHREAGTGTGGGTVPFIPFGSRPGGLAPADPHLLKGGRTC